MLRPFQQTAALRAIEAQFADRLWVFAPVAVGKRWAIAVFIANEAEPHLVDLELCSADRRDELLPYADALNRERGLLAHHTLRITRGSGLTDERIRDWYDYVTEYVRSRGQRWPQ